MSQRNSAYSRLSEEDRRLVDSYANRMLGEATTSRRVSAAEERQILANVRESTASNPNLINAIRMALNSQTSACSLDGKTLITQGASREHQSLPFLIGLSPRPIAVPEELQPGNLRPCTATDKVFSAGTIEPRTR